MSVAKRLRPWIWLAALIVILNEVIALALLRLVALPNLRAQFNDFGAGLPWTTDWLLKVPFIETSIAVLVGGALLGTLGGRRPAREIVLVIVALAGLFAVDVAGVSLLQATGYRNQFVH